MASGRRWVIRIARLLLIGYLGIILVFSALQKWIIFPGHSAQGTADTRVLLPLPGTELVTLKTQTGDSTVAAFGPALTSSGTPHPDPAHCPTIVYFYGNGSSLNYSWTEFRLFRRLGCNVLIPDFLGYGMSSGEPGEQSVYQTADTAYEYLLTRKDVDRTKIVPAGWSLGAAAAIHLASRRPVAGLITVSAFTSMADMGREHYPFLPISLLLHHHFENQTKICDVKCPMLLVHGAEDLLVPVTCCGRLQGAAKAKVSTLILGSAGHNDVFDANPDALFAAMQTFISSTIPAQ